MTSAKNEAIPVQPFWISGITLEAVAKQNGADICGTQRQTQVARGTFVHRIHGESTGFVGGLGKEGSVHWQNRSRFLGSLGALQTIWRGAR